MPMFYFDLRNGSKLTRDLAGVMLEGVHEAGLVAERNVHKMAARSMSRTGCVLEIRDDRNKIVKSVPFKVV